MRNWMMMALDAKLRDEANDEGADGGFGAAFNEGMEDESSQETSNGSNGDADGATGGDAAGIGGDGGDTGAGADGAAADDESGTGEGGDSSSGEESHAAGSEGGDGGEGSEGATSEEGQEGAAAPQSGSVVGGEQVPTDKHAGQQQLDPATLAYMFQQFAANRGNQQQAPASQQGGQQEGTPQQQAPKDWTDYLTDEEKQVLETYDEQWSEVSEAEKIRTQALARHTREQVLAEVNQALAPIVEQYQQSQVQEHFSKIRGAHEDFDDLKQGPLQEWVNQQTNPMIRTAAQQVLQQGSADDVIGLIDLYKRDVGATNTGQSTGAAPNVPASSQVPAQGGGKPQVKTQQKAPPKAPPKPAANHKAASATAAVNTGSRGADPRGNDPSDFEAGFAEEATASN